MSSEGGAANLFSNVEGGSTRASGGEQFVSIQQEADEVHNDGFIDNTYHRSRMRLFPPSFDPTQAIKERVPFGADFNRVMSDATYRTELQRVMTACQVVNVSDGVMLAFMKAMCLSHSKNSGSLLQPDRAMFQFGGHQCNYVLGVVGILDAGYRRFFRYLADFTREVNTEVLRRVNDSEDADHLRWVASDRGLNRHVALVHDSAEACTNLTAAERLAMQASKRSVLAGYAGGNPVDHAKTIRTTPNVSREVEPISPSVVDGPGY